MNALKTVGWGLYLACSWTWCIGMFLPIILMHRYGWDGFFVFAIPNVIGCTAFGYVVRTPERSKALVEKYGTAMAIFAVVTIAFHAYFIAMIVQLHTPETPETPGIGIWTTVGIPVAILLLGMYLSRISCRHWIKIAAVVWLISMTLGITLLPFSAELNPTRPWEHAYWLLPITTFGFLLCPYLDPTFHRAIQRSPSKHSFAVFGVTFAAMICVTSVYSEFMFIASGFTVLLGIHFASQALFTMSLQWKEGKRVCNKNYRTLQLFLLALGCTVAIGIAHRGEFVDGTSVGDSTFGDSTSIGKAITIVDGAFNDYLRFFVFYGLLFPALVAVFMITKREFTKLRLVLFAVLALASLPLLEVGYIGNSPWLTIPPILAFLVWMFVDCRRVSISPITQK